jgi:Eukaryotic mitochondrial regulator protein
MKLSQTDRKEIVAAIQAGKATFSELGAKYGVGRTRIGQIYRHATGTLFRPIKKLSQHDKEMIVAEIQAKKATMTTLAARYGVRQSRISAVFKEMTGRSWRPYKDAGKQELLPPPITNKDTNAISIKDVVEMAVRMNRENPQHQFTLEYNVKEQIISMQQNTTGAKVVIIF